jgi:hypothetical protein
VLLPAAFARGGVHVEAPAITQLGTWEVEVSVDRETCEISCVYRLRRDRFGRLPVSDFLLPPAVDIRIYSDGASNPTTLTVDPAHTREPSAAGDDLATFDESLLGGVRVDLRPPAAASPEPARPVGARRIPAPPAAARTTTLPLRV